MRWSTPTTDGRKGGSGMICLLFGASLAGGLAFAAAHITNILRSMRVEREPISVAIYQNGECTGQSIPKTGDGTQCVDGLGSGGAGLMLLALDADGSLEFYDQPGCIGSMIDFPFDPDND
ncbi:hypothetical protein PVAG01_02695 [Phlyctema vagabunda]|uniref:Uncharacterized protein n=1 Tax=Phlyctema vagabunda TaxID=108571 RepID=A0ABR4PRL6_9HELO